MKTKIFLYGLVLFFVLAPKPTYAYLDPGTGSYLFQLVIAGLLGGLFFIKTIIRKIKGIFKRDSSRKAATTENDENS